MIHQKSAKTVKVFSRLTFAVMVCSYVYLYCKAIYIPFLFPLQHENAGGLYHLQLEQLHIRIVH